MDWFRSLNKEQAASTTANIANVTARTANTTAVVAASTGVAVAITSGPALPIVAGVAVLVAYAAQKYSQNKELNRIFLELNGLIASVLTVLAKIDEVKARRNLSGELTKYIDSVKKAAIAIQATIGKLVGPETLKALKLEGVSDTDLDRQKFMSRMKRITRMISPDSAIRELRDSVGVLTLQFSLLQGAFAIELEKLLPADAKLIAETPPPNAGDIVDKNPDALAAAQDAVNTGTPVPEDPAAVKQGGRRTRRRRRSKKTRKNLR